MTPRRAAALALLPIELFAITCIAIETTATHLTNAARDALDIGGKWARQTSEDEDQP